MNRVFIAEVPYKAEVRSELDKAARFGKLHFLSPERLPPFKPQNVVHFLDGELHRLGYNPQNDCILLVGNVVVSSLFLSVALRIAPAARLLVYDARNAVCDYQLLTVSVETPNSQGDSNGQASVSTSQPNSHGATAVGDPTA